MHLQNFFRVTETMTISISWERAVNPLTGGNWEGVGVQPHINCSADDALEVAHGKAKERLRNAVRTVETD